MGGIPVETVGRVYASRSQIPSIEAVQVCKALIHCGPVCVANIPEFDRAYLILFPTRVRRTCKSEVAADHRSHHSRTSGETGGSGDGDRELPFSDDPATLPSGVGIIKQNLGPLLLPSTWSASSS